MSMEPILAALVEKGALTPFVPRSTRPSQRRLYLSSAALATVTEEYSVVNVCGVRGDVEAAMAAWTLGELVYADWEGNPRFLKRLEPPPPEVWTIRVTDPHVQVRIFCRFFAPDTLIAMQIVLRKELSKKGKKSPRKWKKAMEDCVACWDELFPAIASFAGQSIHDYVKENCDDFPI